MPRKPSGRPNKRPLVDIDWNKVETMMLAGCPGTEIAGSIGIHPDTFYNRFRDEKGIGFTEAVYSKKQGGCGNIRVRQYIAAMRGNTQMLKILGEEWLGQGKRDNADGAEERTLVYFIEKIEKLEAALQSRGISFSDIQDEQFVSHQGPAGEEDQVRNELGSENIMGGEA